MEKIIINSSRTVYYQYDNNGQRVRKAIVDVKYVNEWEEYESLTGLTINVKQETLHINNDNERIALIDTRTDGTGVEPAQLLRYQYSNHLDTATLELDAYGNAIGSASIKHGGLSSTSFVPNKFDSTIPTGGTIWQSIPKSKTFRSLWVIPPVIKLR